jgi:hypothetical protein
MREKQERTSGRLCGQDTTLYSVGTGNDSVHVFAMEIAETRKNIGSGRECFSIGLSPTQDPLNSETDLDECFAD